MKHYKAKKRNPLRIIILSILGLVLLGTILFFSFRNIILRSVIDRKILSIEQRFNLDINYSQARFSELTTVNLIGFTVIPTESDTLVTINEISISIKLGDLILNRLRFSDLKLNGSLVNFQRTGLKSNYLFLLDKKTDTTSIDSTATNINRDYGSRVAVLLNALFNHVPSTTTINRFRITANIDHNHFSFYLPDLQITDRTFITNVQVTDDTIKNDWQVSGRIDSYNKDIKLNIKSANREKVKIPYIQKRWNTTFAFDSAGIQLSYKRDNNAITRLKGNAILSGSMLNHPRISPDDVEMSKSEISYSINIGKSYVEVDSSTYISFNETGFHPYVMYILQPSKILTLRINEPKFSAQSFFNSLPAGLFSNLEGIKVRGNLSFDLNFQIAFNQPDSLIFNSKLRGKEFSVIKFGNTNFTMINEPFLYSAYENGQAVRQFMVGEENPNYRTLQEIPEHLKHAIMTSEDGQFYFHNGFVPDAIRYSMITNIKEKRFARGGSTISMQLVKNVFLNRNKNITRKLEEMLITWLIESRGMVSKDRMLEVYLNVIETGPMTYGVNEAAQFYFKKDVSKLTLAESIYIASIVPRPKLFKYSFDKEGNLREYLANYYTLVSSKMLNRGWITQDEFDKLKPEITIKGRALGYIVTDTLPPPDEFMMERKGLLSIIENIFKKRKKGN